MIIDTIFVQFGFIFSAKDFVDCIDRIRFLSWLMIGSLTHAAITRNEGTIICHPLPVDASQAIADYILYIITGFADQSKTSVIHMSSLFHSFILCQVKTMNGGIEMRMVFLSQ